MRFDIEFKKKCQVYYTNIKRLLSKQKIEEAGKLIGEIKHMLITSEEELKALRFKVNLLKTLYGDMILEEKKAKGRLRNNE